VAANRLYPGGGTAAEAHDERRETVVHESRDTPRIRRERVVNQFEAGGDSGVVPVDRGLRDKTAQEVARQSVIGRIGLAA
jgi:hypothetical protein